MACQVMKAEYESRITRRGHPENKERKKERKDVCSGIKGKLLNRLTDIINLKLRPVFFGEVYFAKAAVPEEKAWNGLCDSCLDHQLRGKEITGVAVLLDDILGDSLGVKLICTYLPANELACIHNLLLPIIINTEIEKETVIVLGLINNRLDGVNDFSRKGIPFSKHRNFDFMLMDRWKFSQFLQKDD